MLRDFSQENLNAFNQFVRTANPDKNDQIAKLAENLLSKYQTQLSKIGGIGSIRAIATANNKTGSFIRVSDSKVQSAFTAVTAQDAQFPLDTQDALTAVIDAMDGLKKVNNAGSDAVNKGLKLWDAFNPDAIQEATASSNEKLKAKEAELEDKLQANSVTSTEGDPDEIVEEIDLGESTISSDLFGTIIKGDTWESYHGSADTITASQWKDYIYALVDLHNQDRIDYGTAYPSADGKGTSLKYYKNKLYVDCWGLIKTGAKIILTKDALDQLHLGGRVNDTYDNLDDKKKGDIQRKQVGDKIVYPDLKTGTSVFIDNIPESKNKKGEPTHVGYDHVMTYVENLDCYVKEPNPDKPKEKTLVHKQIEHALVGIGEEGKGLQVYDLDQKYKEWKDNGTDFKYGNQLNVINDD